MNPRSGNNSKSYTNKVLSKKWNLGNGSEMYLTRKQVGSYFLSFMDILLFAVIHYVIH